MENKVELLKKCVAKEDLESDVSCNFEERFHIKMQC